MLRLLRQPSICQWLWAGQGASRQYVGRKSGPTVQSLDDLFDIDNVAEDPFSGEENDDAVNFAEKYPDRTFMKGKTRMIENSAVSKLFQSIKANKVREAKQCFLLEGMANMRDAVKMGYRPLACIYNGSAGEEAFRALRVDNVRTLKVDNHAMADLCQTNTPQAVAGVFKIPHVLDRFMSASESERLERRSYEAGDYRRWMLKQHGHEVQQLVPRMPLVLLCDAVRDPTNLGVLIRSAAAAGCQAVLCVDCAKPFLHKVVRGSAATVLQIPVLDVGWPDVGELLGGERRVLLSHSTADVQQPKGVTSLAPDLQRDYRSYLLQLRKKDFRAADWGDTDVGSVLVVGNEARGLSLRALDFAMKRPSEQISVPVVEGVNSLNVAMAATVMLYEAQSKLVSPEIA